MSNKSTNKYRPIQVRTQMTKTVDQYKAKVAIPVCLDHDYNKGVVGSLVLYEGEYADSIIDMLKESEVGLGAGIKLDGPSGTYKDGTIFQVSILSKKENKNGAS